MEHEKQTCKAVNKFKLVIVSFIVSMMSIGSLGYATEVSAEPVNCDAQNTVTAKVVAMDQSIMFNRLGAQNVNYMMFALKRDVVNIDDGKPLTQGGAPIPGRVGLRSDKRPRPIVLRVAAGSCLTVELTNLLTPAPNDNPFNALLDDNSELNDNNCRPGDPGTGVDTDGNGKNDCEDIMNINNQVAGRWVSFHPLGMQLVNSMNDDGSYVGTNANSLAMPGQTRTYSYYAEAENAYMVYSRGQPFGGEASGGNVGVGLFGVVNVEPKGASFYRSQVTEEEMRLATVDEDMDGIGDKFDTPDGGQANWGGQPLIDYEARYPNDCASNGVWCKEGKAGLPILNMVDNGELVHSDINAVIVGSNVDGSFTADTYPLESVGLRNPALPTRLEAFREFTVVFHDETGATQAFPKWFEDPVLHHTLHGVRDSFMINYGSGGIGAEIIANRLGVGPMHDCLNCAYEEFFLSAYTVGDAAMLVDVPANAGLELCDPALNNCGAVGPKATLAYFPDDPSNVHHSYKRDFVKFRNLHAGPKEQHIFHLHNQQWLFNPNDDNSNYIDAQGIGPGSGYTYEINFGGSGNRNLSAGDAIFHCHFYPHFAQGMWEMWRIHDVFESGTELAVSGGGVHTTPFALQSGEPAGGARALPDGEITAGTPIPALVPLPGKALPPMPGRVEVVAVDADGDSVPDSSQARVIDRDINPGYPFWIAGIEDTVGQRATTPPLDMLTEQKAGELAGSGDPLWSHPGLVAGAGGWDGGLPRHTLHGYKAGGASVQVQNRLDFTKVVEKARPQYYPEEGTDLEQMVMAFNSKLNYPSNMLLMDGVEDYADSAPAVFQTNGNKPVPSAPYYEPCRDDQGKIFDQSGGKFWGSSEGSWIDASPQYGAYNPRVYKGANIQIDAVLNKAGYHFPQQRIIALWDDVMPTINKDRAPEPLVMRSNTFDCVKYLHTNLVPEYYELDDYQVRTPTDIIGQHIHLPKWDLVSNDGSGNGWNYEDGTLSPGTVRERIHAINEYNKHAATPIYSSREVGDLDGDGVADLEPQVNPNDPLFANDPDWKGARVTIQRWFTDPVYNTDGEDRGLGIVFTHDHYGPSTHQQVGLYATILAEPAKSVWKHNETGELMGTRGDGGPTSWQAQILTDSDADGEPDTGFREFYFEFGDFQHAYEAGVYVGADEQGKPLHAEVCGAGDAAGTCRDADTHSPITDIAGNITIPAAEDGTPGTETFRSAINPSYRQEPLNEDEVFPDIVRFPPDCPNLVNGVQMPGIPRPCSEAISADDVGFLVTNYRNEPIGLRVFDPDKPGPDGKPGTQADGLAGDLAFALQSRTDRAIGYMNVQPGAGTVITGKNGGQTSFPPPINAGGVGPGDPFTPMIRAYPGDEVKIKIQAGSTEHEHNATIHGIKWRQGGSGNGAAPNSGWRNAQNDGISEQFTFTAPVFHDPRRVKGNPADFAYATDSSQDGWWTGMWGIMRLHEPADDIELADLKALPNNPVKSAAIKNQRDFVGVCPATAPLRQYTVVAVSANDVLDNPIGATLLPADLSATMHEGADVSETGGTLVYNHRSGGHTASGAVSDGLHDPTAMLYVLAEDLQVAPGQGKACEDSKGQLGILKPSCKVELVSADPKPLTLRAAAGECVEVTLYNRLPEVAYDLAGYNTLLQMVNRDPITEPGNDPQGLVTFQNNLIRPSSHVGLHPQLVEYDITQHDGANVGLNPEQTVPPGYWSDKGKLKLNSRTMRWYAGHLETVAAGGKGGGINLVATPVEFGGFNLIPADKIKQGQKGLVGAGVILPQGSNWTEDAGDRTQASVTKADQSTFRDAALVFQKGMNHRFGDGTPVPNIASEGRGIPEDSHDAGQMGINYGSEPMWFRFGLKADADFGRGPGGLGAVPNSHEAYSNYLAGVNGDPVTQVINAPAGDEVRIRVLEPTGAGRGTTFNLDGHAWQRDPYVCNSAKDGLPGRCENHVGAAPTAIGHNPIGLVLGHQESVTPGAHFDVVPLNGAGGKNAVSGDYLFADQGSFGPTSGLWGILRVSP